MVGAKWLWLPVLCLPAWTATYYADAEHGNDANSGISEAAPWKSLRKVNEADFRPGDRILLKSGSAWRGQLAPRCSGAEGQPIVLDRYGEGAMPRIDGAGEVEDTVRLYNVQQIEVRGLEITNHGASIEARRGVHIFLDNFGTAKHIVVADLYIHDVNGTERRKDNGGIIFRTNGDKTPSRFEGLTIERNIVWRVDRSGIAAESYHAQRSHWFPSLQVVIRDNFVDDVGGDGIVPWATDGALVEHNIARACDQRSGDYNAGIWQWSTDNTLLRLNEASLTKGTRDGEGFDSDYNSRNTTFEYNYSHDNTGGFMLLCTPGRRNPRMNIGNIGSVVRYNISRDDRTRLFNVSGADQVTVENNAFYIGRRDHVQLLVSDWSGWSSDVSFRGNSFYARGVLRFGHQVARHENGTYGIAPGWGPAKDIVFSGNRYFGHMIDKPTDKTGVKGGSKEIPKIDWGGEPSFDPAHPENFDVFLANHRKWMAGLFQQEFHRAVQ